MPVPAPAPRPAALPPPLATRAERELEFIRRTMERSAGFTAVPGWGGVGMGAIALAAAAIAHRQPTPRAWLATWLLAAGLAFALGVVAIRRKAARAGVDLLGHASRSFAIALFPALAVGALLTFALHRAGRHELLPGVWLSLFGVGVAGAGAYSVPAVPLQGACLLALGAVALFRPELGDPWLLAFGFGVVQIGFGFYLARRHGG